MKKKKVIVPNIVGGGAAVPLGNNMYLLKGRSHEQGGIDIGADPKTGLEAEGGEIIWMGDSNDKMSVINDPNNTYRAGGKNSKMEIKVFSSVPFLNGKSPVDKVLEGEDPNKVFAQQETYKDRNNINDDGTRKAKWGIYDKLTYDDSNLSISDKIKLNVSKNIMEVGRGLNHNSDIFTKVYSKLTGTPQDTYLMDRNSQKRVFLNRGFIEDTSKDYGLVKKAVGNRDIPIYKQNEDAISRDKVIPIANMYNHWGGKTDLKLEHPGSFPSTIYVDPKTGNVYQKAIDLNDYGNSSGGGGTEYGNLQFLANFIDKIGSPTVVTTGIQPYLGRLGYTKGSTEPINIFDIKGIKYKGEYIPDFDDTSINYKIHDYMKNKGFALTKIDDNYSYTLPTVEVTNQKGYGGNHPLNTKYKQKQVIDMKHNNSRMKAKAGLRYILQTNGNSRLGYVPSTGESLSKAKGRDKAELGLFKKVANWVEEHPNTTSDIASAVSNIGGGLASYFTNKNMLKDLSYDKKPIPRIATKLKTNININPQLDKMRESLANYERNIDANTASSQVGLARKQRARANSLSGYNELYGYKENAETELLNKDRLNQQEVANQSIADYNSYIEKKMAFDNTVREKQADNTVNLVNNLNKTFQGLITTGEKRKADKMNALAIMAANPNVNPRILREIGITSITDEMIENWEKINLKKEP